jgi:hypothetical protein
MLRRANRSADTRGPPSVSVVARTLSLVREITRFYRQPSPTSDLGRHAGISPGLPAAPEALSGIVRGVLLHNFTAKVQGLTFPAERMAHMQTVGAEAI